MASTLPRMVQRYVIPSCYEMQLCLKCQTDDSHVQRFSQLHADVAKEAAELGFIPKGTDTKIITPEEADELSSDASILWGTNDAQKSSRAQKSLNWDPIGPSLEQELPAIIRAEHQA